MVHCPPVLGVRLSLAYIVVLEDELPGTPQKKQGLLALSFLGETEERVGGGSSIRLTGDYLQLEGLLEGESKLDHPVNSLLNFEDEVDLLLSLVDEHAVGVVLLIKVLPSPGPLLFRLLF